MFDLRKALIPLSMVGGLCLTSAAWLAHAGHLTASTDLADVERRLEVPVRGATPGGLVGSDAASRILAAPIFALTSGPNAVSDTAVRLDAIAITPTHVAALLSINGKPSVWVKAGSSQDGVTLMEVHPTKVTLDTATGFKEVALGEGAAAAQPGSAQAGQGTQTPAGYHLPPVSPPGAH